MFLKHITKKKSKILNKAEGINNKNSESIKTFLPRILNAKPIAEVKTNEYNSNFAHATVLLSRFE